MTLSLLNVSKNKCSRKPKKFTHIFNCGPEVPVGPILKISLVCRVRNCGRSCRSGFLGILLISFSSSKFLNLSTGLPRRHRRQKSMLDDFLLKFNSKLQQSVLCQLTFLFCAGSLTMPLNMSDLGLNMIRFISNFYWGVFL